MSDTISAAELVAAVLLTENTLLVLGHDARPLPPVGDVDCGGDVPPGRFAAATWLGENGRHWSLVRVDIEQAALMALLPKRLRADGEAHALPEIRKLSLDLGGMVPALTEAMGANGGSILDFLRIHPATAKMVPSVLRAIAEPAGFIEIFGRTHGRELYLQGWSDRLTGGKAELVFESDRCTWYTGHVATYARPDLVAPAQGVAALVHLDDAPEPRDLRRVYFCHGTRYCRLEVYENRLLFADAETAAHVAAILPQLQADFDALAGLKRLAVPRFQGEETLSTLPLPVRAAIDMAYWVPGVGVFLTGWLLDPRRLVATVMVGGTAGFRMRVDDRWTRKQRPDVSQGYSQDPLFAGSLKPYDDGHGFLVFVPCADAHLGDAYLEIALHDGQVGFLPLSPTHPSAGDLRQILYSVDINHPDVERTVASHVGPIVAAIGGRAGGAGALGTYSFGSPDERPNLSIIVPVPVGRTDIDVTIARLAAEPALAGVELLVTASAASAVALGPLLQRLARFYGLSGRLILTDSDDPFDGLAAGAAASNAELLLFLGATVLPREAGWLGHLERLLRSARRGAAISPTLLYEDLSIRFAGARANGWAPPRDAASLTTFAGYARHWLAKEQARPDTSVPVYAVAAECCLIQRLVFEHVGGFSGDLVGSQFKSLDLSLKLRAARQQCLWAPGIEMLAPDEVAGEPEYWMRTGSLVDRWGFDRKWSQLFAEGNT